ncbi:hypothetical protein AB0M44_37420 [Streptosporangium subroseum]|uniref:hypothetical protein n=1 Tax=Streptosporangium subroseum TaxID=106412 RepID=UPI00342D206E
MPYDIAITPRAGAQPELVTLGQRYWDLRGVNDDGRIFWKEGAKRIDPAVSQPHIAAAAGVIVEVAGQACVECGLTPWQPRSRTALDELCRGLSPTGRCVACDEDLQVAMARQADPAAQTKRTATRQRAAHQGGKARAQAEWQAACRIAAQDAYPLALDPVAALDELLVSVDVEAAALACLRYALATAPVPALNEWPRPLSPTRDWTLALARGWYRDRLFKVYPDSDLDAFVTPTFEEAVESAADRSSWEAVMATWTPPVIDHFYLMKTDWYVSYGSSIGTAPQQLDAYLLARLDPAAMTQDRQIDLLRLIERLIGEETIRYFDFLIEDHNLPPVPDNHRPRLVEAAMQVARHRRLGQTYCLAWQAARDAAVGAQKHPRAPKGNMTTHGVNQFEEKCQRAIADPSMRLGDWHEDNRLPLSALTRLVFLSLLKADPFLTSRSDIAAALPPPCREADDPAEHGSQPGEADGDDCDSVLIEALQGLNALTDVDVDAVLTAFQNGYGDLLQVLPDQAETPESLRIATDVMCRAGRAVQDATGDGRAALLAACAAAEAYPAPAGAPHDADVTIGQVLAWYLFMTASSPPTVSEEPPF